MSADNWGVCPRCKKEYDAETERLSHVAEESYGKVKPEEYIRLLSECAERPPFELSEGGTTLREDYELGIDDSGEFEVRYTGGCTRCNFSFVYKYKEQVYYEKE